MEINIIHSTPNGDSLIGYLARVSNPKATPDMPSTKLIRYLILNNHWSPFQMASACVEVITTRDIGRQILRHQSAIGFQEFSGRYAEYEELNDHREARFQDHANRQNSIMLTEDDIEVGEWWDQLVRETAAESYGKYTEALARGIAKEQARALLPEGLVPTKMYLHFSIRTWLHYLNERTKAGVQKEHRLIAVKIEEELGELFPDTFKAFKEIYAPVTLEDLIKAAQMHPSISDQDIVMKNVLGWLQREGKLRA